MPRIVTLTVRVAGTNRLFLHMTWLISSQTGIDQGKDKRTLADHLKILVFARTLALPRPVQIVALADEEIPKLF